MFINSSVRITHCLCETALACVVCLLTAPVNPFIKRENEMTKRSENKLPYLLDLVCVVVRPCCGTTQTKLSEIRIFKLRKAEAYLFNTRNPLKKIYLSYLYF